MVLPRKMIGKDLSDCIINAARNSECDIDLTQHRFNTETGYQPGKDGVEVSHKTLDVFDLRLHDFWKPAVLAAVSLITGAVAYSLARLTNTPTSESLVIGSTFGGWLVPVSFLAGRYHTAFTRVDHDVEYSEIKLYESSLLKFRNEKKFGPALEKFTSLLYREIKRR